MAGKVGFIGLGAMGGPMALNLVKAGFTLVVNDIDAAKTEPLKAKGCEVASSAQAVAAAVRAAWASTAGPMSPAVPARLAMPSSPSSATNKLLRADHAPRGARQGVD